MAKAPGARRAPPDWQDSATLSRVRSAIRARPFLREGGRSVTMVQTHISTVFLTPQFVFKFKRPVDLGFANFRTLRRRRHFCLEEVRLNRRLAANVYLRVAALRESDGGFTFGAKGRIVDWAVVMRRLPASAMLDDRLRRGRVRAEDMERLAVVIAAFHGRTRASKRNAHYGGPEVWRMNWDENFAQVRKAAKAVLPVRRLGAIRAAVERFMARQAGLLARRVAGGFIRNGHGDLRCEHVCIEPPIRIIDCIEFNERFRYGDVANDLAFLLMDLEAEGRPDLARQLLNAYARRSGDESMLPLMPFYQCYRAFVRGKVTAMRLADRNVDPVAREQLAFKARAFFAAAERYARQIAPPRVLLVSGLMGSGKSYLANALGERTGVPVLASDRIRKELAAHERNGHGAAEAREAAFGAGIYTPAWNRRTYETMMARARELLRAGRSVVLDATFARRADRVAAFELAAEEGADAAIVECRVPDGVALSRLVRRSRAGRSISDGRAELYPTQKRAFEPITEVGRDRHLLLQSDGPVEALIGTLLQRFDIPGTPRPGSPGAEPA